MLDLGYPLRGVVIRSHVRWPSKIGRNCLELFAGTHVWSDGMASHGWNSTWHDISLGKHYDVTLSGATELYLANLWRFDVHD